MLMQLLAERLLIALFLSESAVSVFHVYLFVIVYCEIMMVNTVIRMRRRGGAWRSLVFVRVEDNITIYSEMMVFLLSLK